MLGNKSSTNDAMTTYLYRLFFFFFNSCDMRRQNESSPSLSLTMAEYKGVLTHQPLILEKKKKTFSLWQVTVALCARVSLADRLTHLYLTPEVIDWWTSYASAHVLFSLFSWQAIINKSTDCDSNQNSKRQTLLPVRLISDRHGIMRQTIRGQQVITGKDLLWKSDTKQMKHSVTLVTKYQHDMTGNEGIP